MLCLAQLWSSLRAWFALPLAFLAAVLGVTAALSWLVDRGDHDVVLSSPLFGAAAALTLASGTTVEWRSARQRRWLHWPYAGVVLAAGVLLHGVSVPSAPALAVGLPVVAVLAGSLWSAQCDATKLIERPGMSAGSDEDGARRRHVR